MSVKIFLAGPISGAESWRQNLITYLKDNLKNYLVKVVAPRTGIDLTGSLDNNNIVTIYNPQAIVEKKNFTRETEIEQIEWEVAHLDMSDIIVFFIPSQEKDTSDYARTTRLEFGEQIGKLRAYQAMGNFDEFNTKNIVFYANDDFKGKFYMTKRMGDIISSTKSDSRFKNNIVITDSIESFNTSLLKIIKGKVK